MHATDWRKPSSYKIVGKWNDIGEDPCVWKDTNGTYHALIHIGGRIV